MAKMQPPKWASVATGLALATLAAIGSADAADCPRSDALGTSRILSVDAKTTPRVGLKSFPQTLPLEDHEVVLTFDDGPRPKTTTKVLAALAQECVRATFFMVGRNATEHPDMVKRMAQEGHTLGHHTWSHPYMARIPADAAKYEIDHGIASDEMALHGVATTTPSTPFFRFPYFESTQAQLDQLQARGIVVFGADLWASDWNDITPEQELKLVTDRLAAAGRGIILLHDAQARTAAMMPAFLRYLHDNGFHVVHIVPAAPAQKNADAH